MHLSLVRSAPFRSDTRLCLANSETVSSTRLQAPGIRQSMQLRRNRRAVGLAQPLAALWLLSCFLSSARAAARLADSLFDGRPSESAASSQTAQQLMRQAVHRRFGWRLPEEVGQPQGQLPGEAQAKVGSDTDAQDAKGIEQQGQVESGAEAEGEEEKGGEAEERRGKSRQWRDVEEEHHEEQLRRQEREAASEEPDFLEEAQLRLIPAFVVRNYEALESAVAKEIESEAAAVTCPFEAYTIRSLAWCRDVVKKYYLNSPALFEKLNMFACDNLQLYKGRVLCLPEGIDP